MLYASFVKHRWNDWESLEQLLHLARSRGLARLSYSEVERLSALHRRAISDFAYARAHFPDTDAAHAGRDSREFLRETATLLREAGWRVANVDATVIAQRPKLGPHVAGMVATIAEDLGLTTGQVNVKATTTERMGWTGRGEGIAALAVALLESA